MLLKIKRLKNFLFSITKYKVENIHVKSKKLQININTRKKNNRLLSSQAEKSYTLNKSLLSTQTKFINKTTKDDIHLINKEKSKYFTIVSPMIGTFYRSPAPNEAPFVKLNDIVNTNQTVCIIEAMKLMNEIESEVNGYIAEILVEDGDVVDCGQALIRIKQK